MLPEKNDGGVLAQYQALRDQAINAASPTLVMFVDLVGSTAHKEAHGSLEGALRSHAHNYMVQQVAVRHGITCVKSLGDGVLVKRAISKQDDVSSVVRSFVVDCLTSEGRTTLEAQPRLESRIGIALGKVIELDDGDILGPTVDLAARLEGLAKPGQALAVREIFDGAVDATARGATVSVRGLGEPVHIVEVVGPGVPMLGVTPHERWSNYRYTVSIHPIDDDPSVGAEWLTAMVDLSYRGILRSKRLDFLAVAPGRPFARGLADPDVFSCFGVPPAVVGAPDVIDKYFTVTRVRVNDRDCSQGRAPKQNKDGAIACRRFIVPAKTAEVGDACDLSYVVRTVSRRSAAFFAMVAEHELLSPVFSLHVGAVPGARLSFAPFLPPGTEYELTYHPNPDRPTGIELRVKGSVPAGSGVTFMWNESSVR